MIIISLIATLVASIGVLVAAILSAGRARLFGIIGAALLILSALTNFGFAFLTNALPPVALGLLLALSSLLRVTGIILVMYGAIVRVRRDPQYPTTSLPQYPSHAPHTAWQGQPGPGTPPGAYPPAGGQQASWGQGR